MSIPVLTFATARTLLHAVVEEFAQSNLSAELAAIGVEIIK